MFDGVGAESVGGKVLFGCKQAKLLSRNEPVKRAHLCADGTIAIRSLSKFALDFECDLAAVTSAFVVHLCTPPLLDDYDCRNGSSQPR